MRQGIFGFVVATTLTPFAAQAGDVLSVPSSGVLAPPKTVASLYDTNAITTGRPIEARGTIEARPVAATKPAPRRTASGIRSSLAPYQRRSHRPPATLPPGVVAPPPYRPSASYQPPAPLPIEPVQTAISVPAARPAAAPPTRGFFGSASEATPPAPVRTNNPPASSSDLRFVNRGLFTGSTAQAVPPAYRPQSVAPLAQGQPIY